MKAEQVRTGTVWGDKLHPNWTAVIVSAEVDPMKCKALTDDRGGPHESSYAKFDMGQSDILDDRFMFLCALLDDLEEVQKISIPSTSKYEAMIL